MTDTIRELILRVLDYVERTPGAQFSISRWDKGVRKSDENQMHFVFFYTKGDNPVYYIPRDGDEYWSQLADLDEDNLRYLVEQLEGGEMIDIDKVRRDSFNAMWGFLQMGGQKSNVPSLKEHCEVLRKLMTQKTAGQRADKPSDISFAELDTVMNVIVIEAMCLYLSGDLDKLEGEER